MKDQIFLLAKKSLIASALFCLSYFAHADGHEAGAKAVADTYIKATYEGDAETLTKIFHPSAVMNGYLAGKLELGGPEPFIDQIRNNPSLKSGGAPYKASIDYINVSGRAASVTISETGFGEMSFTNYLTMLEENGEWKIISKTYTSY